VLKAGGALLVAPALPRGAARAPRQATSPFAWGVASFDPTHDGVLLWTRIEPTGRPAPLRWELAADEGFTNLRAGGDTTATEDADGCVTVEVTGLEPGRTWWYRFRDADGVESPIGRTRTLPAGPVERLRVASVSCARYADGGFAVYRALADREVDLVLHLGDYIYEDGGAGARAQDPPSTLVRLEDYRRRYAQHREDPDLQALHARHPMVAVWDDHELAGNAWRDGAEAHDDAEHGPWRERVAAAARAREEWLPGRTRRTAGDRLAPWRAVEIGELAEILVLDARSHRDEPPTEDELAAVRAGGQDDRSILGPEQEAWLLERLRRPDRPPWVLLANQVVFHPMELSVPGLVADRIRAEGFVVVDGTALNPDQWDGYPAARDRVVEAIGERGGVIVLTGDVHSSWAWEGPARTDAGPAMIELVTPAVSSTTLADRLPVPAGAVQAILGDIDELAYAELGEHGYLLVDLGPDDVQAEWWHVDRDDPGSQRFGAGRRADRIPPMTLTVAEEPLEDPAPAEGTPVHDDGRPPVPEGEAPGGDGIPLPVVGGGAAIAAAVAAALVAVRRRR